MEESSLKEKIFSRNVPGTTQILQNCCAGIAGCGGLGSNIAVALARSGVGKLILVDQDKVEPSNLNRQHYFLQDIGCPKVEALGRHLKNIVPDIQLDLHHQKITPENLPSFFSQADILLEAFDFAPSKKWLIESWCRLFPDRYIVSGNGMSGIGNHKETTLFTLEKIIFCGDGKSEMKMGLCAAKVALVANMQAHAAIEILWKGKLS